MRPDQRAALLDRYPACYFCRVVKGDVSLLLAIPKKHWDKPIQTMPGMTPDLLHGARITLKE